MVQHWSSTVPLNLLVVHSSCGHNWCLCCHQRVQSWGMWWTVCSASLQSQCAHLLQCSEYSGLFMSGQTVDWVCKGVLVSSGSSSPRSLTVAEQGYGFLVSGGGQGLQLFASRFGQMLFNCLEPHRGLGSSVGPQCILKGRCCRSLSSWWACWPKVLEIRVWRAAFESVRMTVFCGLIHNERISRALFHVKHAQLRWTGANTKIENACI